MSTYPPHWRTLSRGAMDRAHWRCEHCGAQFPLGDTRHATIRNADGKPLILTVHHLDGNPANCEWTNLLCCCQACHLHVQGVWAPGQVIPLSWKHELPTWLIERGLPYQDHPQLDLFDWREHQAAALHEVEDVARRWGE